MNLGRAAGVKTDINVTPLIDVVLVLLIIFLVTMPMMMRTITVDVPPDCGDDCLQPGMPLVLTLRADLSVTLTDGGKETTVAGTDLARALRVAVDARPRDRAVFVDVEDPVPWNETVAAMDTIRGVAASTSGEAVSVALKVRP